MAYKFLPVIACLLLSYTCISQTKDTTYQSKWFDIDTTYFKRGLTRTALDKVNAVYTLAKKEDKPVQQIKALLYRMRLEENIKEDVKLKQVDLLETEIAASKNLNAKSVLMSLLAQKYKQYLDRNRWRIYNRTKTTDFKKDDIATWTISDLDSAITYWFNKSLENLRVLKETRLEKFDPILNNYTNNYFRPTLYDLLAHRALDYYKAAESYSTKAVDAFVINQPEALGTLDQFINHSFKTKEKNSRKLMALQLFQEMIKFHRNSKDTAALIDVNLERLDYVKNNGSVGNEECLFYEGLYEMAEDFKSNRFAALSWAQLAEFHANKARQYTPTGDTSTRYDYNTAMDILRKFIPLTDSTKGHYQLYNLYHSILEKDLDVQAENVNVPTLPFLAYVAYRNADSFYYRVVKNSKAIEDSLKKLSFYNYGNQRSLFSVANKFPFVQQQVVGLPATNDYQKHSTEVKIDGLAAGEYYLLGSTSASFSNSEKLTWQKVYVSNISFVNNANHYFVLNRTTGLPLLNASVQVWERKWNNSTRRNEHEKRETYKTDKNGYFLLKVNKNESRQVSLEIKYGTDYLFMDGEQYVYPITYRNSNDGVDYNESERKEFEEDNATFFYFTDRSIYRPGQMVYFKMLGLTKDLKTLETKLFKNLKAKDSVYVYLKDVNNQKVDSVKVNLNEFGSFSGSFKIPANVLTGRFTITIDGDSEERGGEFSVEEYKRPTFYVEIEKPKGSYRIGDSVYVKLNAKAYAGNVVDGATVKFKVTRKGRFLYPWLWRGGWFPQTNETIITFGEAKTDASGNYNVSFPAIADPTINKDLLPVFDFEVHADVTDIAGETRSGTTLLSVGYHSLNIQLTVKEREEADSLKYISVSTTNIAGDMQPASVQLSVYPLQSPKNLLRNKYWQQPDQFIYTEGEFKKDFPNDEYKNEKDKTTWPKGKVVYSVTVNTKDSQRIKLPAGLLKSGWYLVEAKATDKDGREIKDVRYVQLFSREEGQFKTHEYLLSVVKESNISPGEQASFLLGSGAENVYLIQEIQRQPEGKSNMVRSEFVYHKLDKNVRLINVPASTSDIGGMAVNVVFVKDNRMFSWNQPIYVQPKEKKLEIEVLSFRNKTEPGNKEKWSVRIKGPGSEAATAEVLTSMYDASLDQFKPHAWSKPVLHQNQFYGNGWDGNSGFTQISANENQVRVPSKSIMLVYPEIDIYLMNRKGKKTVYDLDSDGVPDGFDGRGLQGRAAGVQVQYDGQMDEGFMVSYGSGKNKKMEISKFTPPKIIADSKETIKENENEQAIQIRKNFNETAFFLPHLLTDKDGNVSFEFTMPDALTQWKWQVLAHDKNALFGLISNSIVTQKTLMVQTNAPRFLREGDKIQLSAKISNMSEAELSGKATLELFDALTGQPVDGIFFNHTPNQYFTAEPGQSTSVRFSIEVPFNFTQPLTWRVVAKAGNFGDGEENTLPVLSNRMLVTESMPLFLRGDRTKAYSFDKLRNNKSETLQHQSLTVEYTPNPVWYAIQSLPYLMDYPYECAEQTFNRIFANALGARIIKENPSIEKVFALWLKDSTALKSNLQKNEELKSILLQETPWVLQAQSEEEQKRNIAMLFDMVKMSSQLKGNLEKLKQMQLPNGGFAWFKGGRTDRYMTQYIITGIGRLQHLNAIPASIQQDIKVLTEKAMVYLDEELTEDYNNLLKYKTDLTKNNIGPVQMQYLYMRTMFDKAKFPIKNDKAFNYYYGQGKQFWNKQNNYFKAMTASFLYRNNDKAFAKKNIIPSIFENAVIDKDSAMYWKENVHGYYWYQAPVEQQTLIMEMANMVYKEEKSPEMLARVNDMKTWLLKQKQTTRWSNTKATADACYALVMSGQNELGNLKRVNIQLGNVEVNNQQQAEAGTGYIKKRFEGNKVETSMGNVTVKIESANAAKASSTPTWGAVYWQYFEDMDKITPATGTPFTIKKNLFIERNTATGAVLVPVNDGDELKPGDKIKVRIELRTDRNLEYVHLKDMRAAGMEPVNVMSSYKWQDGLGYYESTKDAATNFFIGYMPRGTYVFEYPLFVTHNGNFSVGIATAQCMYAPEFSSHSEGIRVRVK